MTVKVVFLIVFLCVDYASADWFNSVRCRSQLKGIQKNIGKGESVLKKDIFLSKRELASISFLTDDSRANVEIYPWEGLHYILSKGIGIISVESDKDSFLDLNLKYRGKKYSVFCEKSYR